MGSPVVSATCPVIDAFAEKAVMIAKPKTILTPFFFIEDGVGLLSMLKSYSDAAKLRRLIVASVTQFRCNDIIFLSGGVACIVKNEN
jgi:hypothetical protein